MVYESSAPLAGLLEAGSEEGAKSRDQASGRRPIPGYGARSLSTKRSSTGQGQFSILFGDNFLLVRQRRLRQRQLPETLRAGSAGDVKSRCSEWLSMPNVGLTAAFAAPKTRGTDFFCSSGTPLPLWQAIFVLQYYGTVFDLRSEPWKGPPGRLQRDPPEKG